MKSSFHTILYHNCGRRRNITSSQPTKKIMNSNGGFHEEEKNGTLTLVYHHPIFQPIPQTQSKDTQILPPLFLCPFSRRNKANPLFSQRPSECVDFPVSCSPEYIVASDDLQYHSVLPLFWCNNKYFDYDGGCSICRWSYYGTDYFFCEKCDYTFHKECVQSPSMIKHPYHPEHSLHLFYLISSSIKECFFCGNSASGLVYCCTRCDIVMHTTCAMKSISFIVDNPKSHDHPLTLFAKASLICNVCGLIRSRYLTYICAKCSFAAHSDCMYAPRIIKISRHHHRISYTSSLQFRKWSCGVCGIGSIDRDYGAYICPKCSDYAVHTRCALRKDVWDGVELEGVPEDDDISQDPKPFKMISEGVILHFLHDHHHLQLKANIFYNENKICEACVMPIAEGKFYSCRECAFILHETCAESPRRIQHALHPHPLTLKATCRYHGKYFVCNSCDRRCNGFVYECRKGDCEFDLDVRCASISEPFVFPGHGHPLFLALPPEVKPTCTVCKLECKKQFNCIGVGCDFIICFKCATLPYKAKYKHDEKHMLTLLWGKEVCRKDCCDICERNLGDTSTELIYGCKDCCTSLHIECLFDDALLKPGQILKYGKEVTTLGKKSLSRPLCDNCKYHCHGRIYLIDKVIMCSWKCAVDFLEKY